MTPSHPYEAPTVRDLGDLTEITADVHHVTMGIAAQAAGASSPMTPPQPPGGGGGSEVQTATLGSESSPSSGTGLGFGDTGDTSPGTAEGGNEGGGSPTGATLPGDTSSGRLPFTGFPAAFMAGLGGAMSAAGVALRRALRKPPE